MHLEKQKHKQKQGKLEVEGQSSKLFGANKNWACVDFKYYSQQSEKPKQRMGEKSCWRRRFKQILIAGILVTVIVAVVVDAVLKPCMLVETEGQRVQRLYCDGLLNVTQDFEVVPGQNFTCGSDDEWVVNEQGNACEQASSCLGAGFQDMLLWIEENPAAGWVAVALIYMLATVFLIPGSVLTIGAGIAFGTAFGLGVGTAVAFTAVWLGAVTGSVIAFLMGRYLLKEFIQRFSDRFKIIQALDRSFQEKGFQLVFLMRLSPIIPFNVFNFVMGSTSCNLKNYTIATMVGIIPGSIAFIFAGALIGAAINEQNANFSNQQQDGSTVIPELCEEESEQDKTVRTVALVLGIVATIVAAVLLSHYARKEFLRLKHEAGVPDDLDDSASASSNQPELEQHQRDIEINKIVPEK